MINVRPVKITLNCIFYHACSYLHKSSSLNIFESVFRTSTCIVVYINWYASCPGWLKPGWTLSKSKYFEEFGHFESVAIHRGPVSRNIPVTNTPSCFPQNLFILEVWFKYKFDTNLLQLDIWKHLRKGI